MGFARSDLTVDAIRAACMPYMKVSARFLHVLCCLLTISVCVCVHTASVFSSLQAVDSEAERLAAFFSRNSYISGKYVDESSFANLNTHLLSLPGGAEANRLFYLALPPSVYHDVTKNIKHQCMSTK